MSKLTVKKYLILVALWLAGILGVIGTSIYLKSHEGDPYNPVAMPYVQKAVEEISLWDPVSAKALMAKEVAANIPDDKFVRAMEFFSQLGALQKMEQPAFKNAFVDQKTEIGKQTIVEYDVDALYENGDAEINIKLLQRGPTYEIYQFNFRSEKLTPPGSDTDR